MSWRQGENGPDENGEDDMRDDPSSVASTVDVVGQVVREEPELAAALEALSAALDRVELPAGAWDRLAAALTVLGPNAGHDQAAEHPADQPQPAWAPAPAFVAAVEGAGRPAASARNGRRPGWNLAHPMTWLATAVVAAAIVGLGAWGTVQARERARLVEEQRVLSYWMANPEMRMVALREVGSAESAPGSDAAGRLGVVCILPDGRALLLQPTPAARGTNFVVMSRGGEADAELASGTSNVIRFDLAGAQRVVIMLASGAGERVPIAWADVY